METKEIEEKKKKTRTHMTTRNNNNNYNKLDERIKTTSHKPVKNWSNLYTGCMEVYFYTLF